MLFRKRIDRYCSYCQHCTKLNDEQVLCTKRGVVAASSQCGKFRYDPCKRIPGKAKTLDFSKYDQEDFSL